MLKTQEQIMSQYRLEEYKGCIFNRRHNKSLMIPVNLYPEQEVFKKFLMEFKDEYLGYLDAIDNMFGLGEHARRKQIKTDSDIIIYNFMSSLMNGLKLESRRTFNVHYELPLQRKYLFSKMLLENELIPLIPRVADCIVDLRELGYREHGKFWCLQRYNENFVICGCDTVSYSDYGTIPLEFSFPDYSPEYFWDIVSYNKVLKINTRHSEISEQLTKQRNNRHIELITTSPPNYLYAKFNHYAHGFEYVDWTNNELVFQ
jgi:hypothetical protein